MSSREEIVQSIYENSDEDARLSKNRHGQLEYRVTMAYIHRYLQKGCRVLELGAGTGRYSIALAKEVMDVTAIELVEHNLDILKQRAEGLPNLRALQGDATDLSMLEDECFDVTLVLGPMYHLYEKEEISSAIKEAIRVTKKGGVLLFAFLSIYAIMYADYCYGNWKEGIEENYDKDLKPLRFKEQLFTGYDIVEFESLFKGMDVEHLLTVGVDGMLEPIEKRPDFHFSDEDFDSFTRWYLTIAEKRELLGGCNHLLYICKKK